MQTESLPPFTLRQSTRARRWRLQISPRRGLELIVPHRFDSAQIPIILQNHQRWIARAWQRMQHRMPTQESTTLPASIHLAAINETWNIDYLATNTDSLQLSSSTPEQLILQGNIQGKLAKTILIKWLHTRGRHHLLPWLAQLSASTGLVYADANIRSAWTRWGSCTAKRRISLNYQLLFLPPELVQHVLLHELCHLQHLNHSKQFWRLIERFDPAYQLLRTQLKQAHQHIPGWLTFDQQRAAN